MEASTNNSELFNSIAQTAYSTYQTSRNDLKQLCGDTNFDMLERSQQEISRYFELSTGVQSNAVLCIVFLALSVEAFINFYGVKRLGDKSFNDHYERISTLDKIVIITKVSTGKDFPKDNNLFGQLKRLFRLRNMLVHAKSQTIDFYNDNNAQFEKKAFSEINEVYDNIDSLIRVYTDLKEMIMKLEGKELDVISEQGLDLVNEIIYNVDEMIRKSLGK
jgi:hypothetical protein